ncbi:hypothetical protein GQ55_1G344800 [Panicum hallii var. hallii]|uniref:Uncharacterized protein n=1 Tax=Panicum hallii var. hallii TaxID=1504633 RepID=A0A2T7FAL3_9POAL|nr:hypothetical protein GQ55_1G344800 [Panicum hallii var. hallii]
MPSHTSRGGTNPSQWCCRGMRRRFRRGSARDDQHGLPVSRAMAPWPNRVLAVTTPIQCEPRRALHVPMCRLLCVHAHAAICISDLILLSFTGVRGGSGRCYGQGPEI